MLDDQLTYRVIGCAMKVHNTLGSGFQEVIYQRALAIEMSRAEIDFGREVEQAAYGFDVGLLINFGGQRLEHRRIFNDLKGSRR